MPFPRPAVVQPDPGRHGIWQTAWALVAALLATLGSVYWSAAWDSTPKHELSYWPVYLFAAGILVAPYMVFAPITKTWPYWEPQEHLTLVRIGRAIQHFAGWAIPPVVAEPVTAPATAAAHDATPHTFVVKVARWEGINRKRDVTDVVRALVDGGRLDFPAVSQILTPGEDIEPGIGKILFVVYSVDGSQEKVGRFPESTPVRLP